MLTDKFGEDILFSDKIKNAKCYWLFSTGEYTGVVLYRNEIEETGDSVFNFFEYGTNQVNWNGKYCNNDKCCILDDEGNLIFFKLETIMKIFGLDNNIEQN